jgi:hypothetical protein
MFGSCFNLKTIPPLDTRKGLNFSSMFSSCFSLTEIPLLVTKPTTGTQLSTAFNNTFNTCYTLTELPELDLSAATANTTIYNSMIASSRSLARIRCTGINQSFSLPSSNRFSATELNELYTNLAVVGASGAGAKTLTITGAYGSAASNKAIAIAKGWTVSG